MSGSFVEALERQGVNTEHDVFLVPCTAVHQLRDTSQVWNLVYFSRALSSAFQLLYRNRQEASEDDTVLASGLGT